MKINTYLWFNENCLEAFEYYKSVFGGEFSSLMTYRDGPDDLPVAEEDLDRIMHVSLPIGSSVLMGSESCSSLGPPRVMGNNFSLCFEAESKAHADEIFAKLTTGGKVLYPMEDAFWGAYYGKLTDKFGINWDIIAEHTQEN